MVAVPISASVPCARGGENSPAAGHAAPVTFSGDRQHRIIDARCRPGVVIPQKIESVKKSSGGAMFTAVDEQKPAAGSDQGGGHGREVCGIGGRGVHDDDDRPMWRGMGGEPFDKLVEMKLTGTCCGGDDLKVGTISTGRRLPHCVGKSGGVALSGQGGHDVGRRKCDGHRVAEKPRGV